MVRDDDDMDLEEATSHAAMLQNKQQITLVGQNKRKEQLLRWESSEMNGESQQKRRKPRVKFQDSDIFLSACMSGDEEEVEDLLVKGADINTATVDGLTALHQSVIDSKPEMVRFLCEKGADVNAQDNEGWTPLHAAACCGNLPIVKYLCEHGADISIINSDKELAMDLADDEDCREFLESDHVSKGIDPEKCRDAELTTMMTDVKNWIRDGTYGDHPHFRTGATAMHVAAAKGYTQLLELLIQAGGDIRVRDRDGWTPLHAASHWSERDSCKILMERGASIHDVNNAGQDVLTVAEKDIIEYLEELEKAAEDRRSLPASNASVLGDKNSRIHHEEHTISADHKRELQHRDQSSEKEMLHSFAKVPRMEKSPSAEPPSPLEVRRVMDEEDRVSSERVSRSSEEKSKSSSEPPISVRSSEEKMSASTASELTDKSMSTDRSSVVSATPSTASTGSSISSSMSTTASTSTTPTSNSLQGDQNVAATVPLRPLQQPSSWINRGVQLISRSNSSGSTRTMSTESGSVSTSATPSSAPSSASPANLVFTKPLPWQSNTINESEAERRNTARLQRQNRRSTQGVTKEQLEEARGLAAEEAIKRRGSGQTNLGIGASSGTAVRENPTMARLASEERDSMSSDRSESMERVQIIPGRMGISVRNSSDDKSTGRSSPSTTSAVLTLPAAPSPSSTPSATNIRRKSQQGIPLSRSNRRGTGPVLPEDLQLPKTDLFSSSQRNGLSSTVNRTFLTFNKTDPRIGGSISQEKSQSVPPMGSTSTQSTVPPLRSAAINPSNPQRVTSRVQPSHSLYSSQVPQTSTVLSRPTETNLNYKALYEKERLECEKLRKEIEELKRNDNSLTAYRVGNRFRNGTSTISPTSTPIGKSPSSGSVEDGDRRSLERKIADLELQVKAVSQLKMENQRLKEENGALVRVISKMTS